MDALPGRLACLVLGLERFLDALNELGHIGANAKHPLPFALQRPDKLGGIALGGVNEVERALVLFQGRQGFAEYSSAALNLLAGFDARARFALDTLEQGLPLDSKTLELGGGRLGRAWKGGGELGGGRWTSKNIGKP